MVHWRVYMNDVAKSLCNDDFIINHERKSIQNARSHVANSGCCSGHSPCVNVVVARIIRHRLYSHDERIRVVWQLEDFGTIFLDGRSPSVCLRARVWSTHWYDDCTAKWSYPIIAGLKKIFPGAIVHYHDETDDEKYDIKKNHSDVCVYGPYDQIYGGDENYSYCPL